MAAQKVVKKVGSLLSKKSESRSLGSSYIIFWTVLVVFVLVVVSLWGYHVLTALRAVFFSFH